LHPDDGWVLTQHKEEITSLILRRELEDQKNREMQIERTKMQIERRKIIEENRMRGYEHKMNLESSKMDFEWLIKLAEEIDNEVVDAEYEIVDAELEEEIGCIIMLEEMDYLELLKTMDY